MHLIHNLTEEFLHQHNAQHSSYMRFPAFTAAPAGRQIRLIDKFRTAREAGLLDTDTDPISPCVGTERSLKKMKEIVNL